MNDKVYASCSRKTVSVRYGVKQMYGNYLLRYLFRGSENEVIATLRESVRRFIARA